MRVGKLLMAVAITVGTTVACFSGDGPTDEQPQESGWQFEDFAPPTAPAAPAPQTQTKPGQPKAGPIELSALKRTARSRAKTTETTRPQRTAMDPRTGVINAGWTTDQNAKPQISQTAFEEPQKSQDPLPNFGDLNGAAVKAPVQIGNQNPATAPSEATTRDVFGNTAPSEMFAPLKPQVQPRKPQSPPAAAPVQSQVPVTRTTYSSEPVPVQPVSNTIDVSSSTNRMTGAGPMVSVEVRQPETVSVGRASTCSFVVRNTGGSIAGNVILEAYVPETVKIASAEPKTVEAESLTWTLGELEAGEERTVRVEMVPTASGAVEVQSFVRYSGQVKTTFTVVEPKLKLTLAGPKEAQLGEAAPYVITVSNPGSGAARNVVISAKIPAGLEHRRGNNLTMQVGSLNPGESRNVRLALTAIDAGDQALQIQATAEGDLSDQAAAAVAVVAPKLDLQIEGPKIRHAGRRGRYAVKVSNPGNIATSNVRAKYRIPEGFELLEADRGGRRAADGTIEWFVGQLAPGESSVFTVTVRAKQLGTFTHQAGVVSEHGATKSADMTTRVEGVASLAITIQDRDDPVEVGQETLYEIRIANEGSRDATNVVLSCELPTGMKVTGVRGPVRYTTRNGVLEFAPLETLAAGKSSVYQVIVSATGGGSQRLRARLTSDSVREPLISEELTRVYAD